MDVVEEAGLDPSIEQVPYRIDLPVGDKRIGSQEQEKE